MLEIDSHPQGRSRRARRTPGQSGHPEEEFSDYLRGQIAARYAQADMTAPTQSEWNRLTRLESRGRFPTQALRTASEVYHSPERFIVHDDPDLLVINKPPFIVSQAMSDGAHNISLEHVVRKVYGPTLQVAHRLDADTSGLIMFGKNPETLVDLGLQLANKDLTSLRKIYVVLLHGKFKKEGEKTVKADLAFTNTPRVRVLQPGESQNRFHGIKDSKTAFTPLTLYTSQPDTEDYQTLTMAQIFTGRKHQVRVTAAQCLGMPVVGDTVYGDKDSNGVPRQMLHAFGLRIRHPRTHESMILEAPLPADMNHELSRLTLVKNY